MSIRGPCYCTLDEEGRKEVVLICDHGSVTQMGVAHPFRTEVQITLPAIEKERQGRSSASADMEVNLLPQEEDPILDPNWQSFPEG